VHGVPKKLNLSGFHGLSLRAVDILENIVYFRFGTPEGREMEIGVEGRWELELQGGEVALEGSPLVVADSDRQLFPLGSVVENSRVNSPLSFELVLAGGSTLRVFDSSEL
jgi:hypothetical protein